MQLTSKFHTDLKIMTSDGQEFDGHKGLISKYFKKEEEFSSFISDMSFNYSQANLQ